LLERAGCWFLQSGIQESDGGVARYHLIDSGKNLPVSYEITGYAVSALTYLHSCTGNAAYLDAALRAGRLLTRRAWDAAASIFPFEPASDRAYFFDTGIIVRGLLALWRATGDEEFLTRAREGALSLAFDFLGDGAFHPIVSLPDKQPLPYEAARWSRTPGCFQLKAALPWKELGDPHASKLFDSMLAFSLASHRSFLAGQPDRLGLMDRLHAYSYFLEALLFVADRPEAREALAEGLARAAALFREIAPEFERADVAAQILRVRLIAHHQGALPLDEEAAREEAAHAASLQSGPGENRVQLRGGFYFGKRQGALLPFSNPVSTAFCLQALELWRQHEQDCWRFELPQLI
jgi:hypothetical protein